MQKYGFFRNRHKEKHVFCCTGRNISLPLHLSGGLLRPCHRIFSSPDRAAKRGKRKRQEECDKGEMVEWSITAVLKTAALKGAGGSNPSLSAG